MNKLISIILVTMTFAVVGCAHMEGSGGGVVAHAFGRVTATEGGVGDLEECQEGVLIRTKLSYSYLRGVCDNGSKAMPCNGRVTVLDEECLVNETDVAVIGRRIVSRTPRGQFRICFDDSAASDCSGTPPNAVIIGRGPSRAQVRAYLDPGSSTPEQGTAEFDVTHTKSFTIHGAKRRLEPRVSVGHFTLAPDPDFDNCGGDGCPIVAAFVSGPSNNGYADDDY